MNATHKTVFTILWLLLAVRCLASCGGSIESSSDAGSDGRAPLPDGSSSGDSRMEGDGDSADTEPGEGSDDVSSTDSGSTDGGVGDADSDEGGSVDGSSGSGFHYDSIFSGVPMLDTTGALVNAHGVGFIKVGSTYYMVGEQRSGKNDTYSGTKINAEDTFTGGNDRRFSTTPRPRSTSFTSRC
jgi:hypothetical protein